MDFSPYEMIWLGGDMASSTSEDSETMDHCDSIFHFDSENTLWSVGNHDYADLSLIEEYTNRPAYYVYNRDVLTILVLDTQDDYSNISGAQKDFFLGVIDTLQETSHLIILHHKLIWMYGDDYLESIIPDVANGGLGDCFYCINPNNFYSEIYPKLLEVKAQGIDVICIGGDIGFKVKEFEYTTSEGIHFLASGLSWIDAENNKVLLFHHFPEEKRLTWEFKKLTDLE